MQMSKPVLKVETLIDDIEQGAFHPMFQPIIDANGRVGVEVLLRWDNGHHVEESIQCLTQHGHIAWFTRQLCKKVANELATQPTNLTFVSVNVAPSHLLQLTFVRDIYPLWQACEKLGIALWLELTEGEAYPTGLEEKRLVSQLGVCRGMGMKIALDDYGCGFNVGEAVLSLVRPSVLKLDRTLIKNKCEDSMLWARLRFLARKYKIDLLAEGIENPEDMRFCHRQGIRYYQGYFVGRPGRLSDVADHQELKFG
jgi:EAL domain-containing protein (putative c-di-GMP-specific phosphodiesterase class I)